MAIIAQPRSATGLLLRRLAGWLFVGAVFAGLCGLGLWQLQRAAEKRAIEAERAAAGRAAPVALPLDRTDYRALRFRPVTVAGRYDAVRQLLLDNQVRDGRVGYSVLTPLVLADGRAVLVDRGWVAQGLTRALLPDLTVAQPVDAVRGRVYVPFAGGLRLGAVSDGAGWPRVVQYLDFAALGALVGRPLLPLVLRLDPAEPNGYRRDWPAAGLSHQRHLAYAAQWFGLALAWLALSFYYKRVHKRP